MQNRNLSKRIALTGVMSALVFAGSWIQIPLFADSRLHLGNVMCLLSAFLLGPVSGGLAAGIGSIAFDFTNPLYISTAPFTFIFKFLMAFVCGKISWQGENKGENLKRNLVAGGAGILTYVILYISRNIIVDIYFKGLASELVALNATQRLILSTINGVIAVLAAVPLAKAIKIGLSKNNLS